LTDTDRASEIEKKLSSNDLKVIETCLDMAKDLIASEQNRSDHIGTRAANILGFAGVIGALTLELITLLATVRAKNYCVSVLMSTIYISMLFALSATIWLSFGGRRRSITAVPQIDDIFGFQADNEINSKKKWLADLISAYKRTNAELNTRVTDVYEAQRWLTIGIGLLLIVATLGVITLMLP